VWFRRQWAYHTPLMSNDCRADPVIGGQGFVEGSMQNLTLVQSAIALSVGQMPVPNLPVRYHMDALAEKLKPFLTGKPVVPTRTASMTGKRSIESWFTEAVEEKSNFDCGLQPSKFIHSAVPVRAGPYGRLSGSRAVP
jgi:hypothetical protein